MQKISVVMPVYNALPFLDDSVRSILEQSHSNFDFIIRDDGSTDGSREALRRWAGRDRRILLYEGERNLGPAGSADWVARKATTPIVARMDADDIALPERLRRELAVLDSHPDAVLVGCLFEGIDGKGRVVRRRDRSPLRSSGFAAPFPHGSIMYRREAFERAGGYRESCRFWEDLDLYFRMSDFGRVMVLPEPLYRFRYSSTSTRLTSHQERVEQSVDLMFDCIEAVESCGDYEHVLASPPPAPRKVRPQVFVSFGSIRLWGGQSPGTLMRMLRRARWSADLGNLKVLLWSMWASLSPRTLRSFLRSMAMRRDLQASAIFPDGRAYEWGYCRSRSGSKPGTADYGCRVSHSAGLPSTSTSSTPSRPAMLGPRSSTSIGGNVVPAESPGP